jgi:hypothetical protein
MIEPAKMHKDCPDDILPRLNAGVSFVRRKNLAWKHQEEKIPHPKGCG